MRTPRTDIVEKILRLNNKLMQFATKNIFTKSGISPLQFNILGEVLLEGKLEISELKKRLILSAPALSQVLQRMQTSKLIERHYVGSDRRKIILYPTAKGKELYTRINTVYIGVVEEKLFFLTPESIRELLFTLDDIEKALT